MKLRIRDLREDSDKTQKEITAYLLCDQSLYSKYEREERPLPLEYAVKLARFYGVSVDYLVGLTNEKKPYHGDSTGGRLPVFLFVFFLRGFAARSTA